MNTIKKRLANICKINRLCLSPEDSAALYGLLAENGLNPYYKTVVVVDEVNDKSFSGLATVIDLPLHGTYDNQETLEALSDKEDELCDKRICFQTSKENSEASKSEKEALLEAEKQIERLQQEIASLKMATNKVPLESVAGIAKELNTLRLQPQEQQSTTKEAIWEQTSTLSAFELLDLSEISLFDGNAAEPSKREHTYSSPSKKELNLRIYPNYPDKPLFSKVAAFTVYSCVLQVVNAFFEEEKINGLLGRWGTVKKADLQKAVIVSITRRLTGLSSVQIASLMNVDAREVYNSVYDLKSVLSTGKYLTNEIFLSLEQKVIKLVNLKGV